MGCVDHAAGAVERHEEITPDLNQRTHLKEGSLRAGSDDITRPCPDDEPNFLSRAIWLSSKTAVVHTPFAAGVRAQELLLAQA